MTTVKVKKGDMVLMLVGKDRGKRGKIVRVLPEQQRVVVEGLNLVQKRTRPRRQGQSGELVNLPRPISTSNVKLVCPKCGLPARVGYLLENKKKLRQCKKCRETFS